MFLKVLKVLGVGIVLLWCGDMSICSSVFSGQSSENLLYRSRNVVVSGHSLPGSVKELVQEALPLPNVSSISGKHQRISALGVNSSEKTETNGGSQPSVSPQRQREMNQDRVILRPSLPYLEIEVKHGEHTFTLFAHSGDGNKNALYHCRVGLGGPEFPTPVGTYYVTHIYDEQPWWIPPKDRAWAAGEKPSRKVYGGTMAPLLKKRDVKSKKQTSGSEDMIAGRVKLEDYGYRFHGTNSPRSIGRNQSHGCVRMLPTDAKKVAQLIKERVGTTERRESENGSFVLLKCPVRLNLVK